MTLVWFVYGLAFFVLGLVILVYPKRGSRFDMARYIWMVGTFGILHGLNEWLDMFIDLGGPLPVPAMANARLFTLSGSFFFLILFGTTILSRNARYRRVLRLLPFLLAGAWLAILVLSEPQRRLLMGDIWARYLLCAPGAVLTAWGLLSQIPGLKGMKLYSVTGNLAIAAATFLVYGVLAGVFVKKADFFPATVLNYESFLSVTAVPVQVFRAVCAVIAAWSIIRVLDIFRWESQEALRISELRCATIAGAMPVFLFMTDRNLVVTFIQGKGLEGLGLRLEQIRGRPISEVFASSVDLAEDCRRALAGQEFITATALNGVPFEIYYSALRDRAGAATTVVGVALDVSARIQAQKEVDEYRRKMEKHAREAAVGVLSATMAQQVLEPLSVTQLVLEKTVADLAGAGISDTARGGISRSLAEVRKANETLNRFIEIVNPGGAAVEQPVGLYQIAKRTLNVFADSAQRRKLTIAIKDLNIVPLTAVSPREVEQMFYHLIQRAIDAAGGDTEQKLVISCLAGEGHIELSFCDTCGGLPPGQSEHTLDPVLPSLEGVDGLGLGLAIVKRIVAGHGGRITVDTLSGGTTFKIRLPVKRTYRTGG